MCTPVSFTKAALGMSQQWLCKVMCYNILWLKSICRQKFYTAYNYDEDLLIRYNVSFLKLMLILETNKLLHKDIKNILFNKYWYELLTLQLHRLPLVLPTYFILMLICSLYMFLRKISVLCLSFSLLAILKPDWNFIIQNPLRGTVFGIMS